MSTFHFSCLVFIIFLGILIQVFRQNKSSNSTQNHNSNETYEQWLAKTQVSERRKINQENIGDRISKMTADDLSMKNHQSSKAPTRKNKYGQNTLKSVQNILILDTETTGLGSTSEVVQLSVIDGEGQELIDTYVRPFSSIPPDATNIHGITDEMVSIDGTPTIVHTLLMLLRLVQKKFPDGNFQLVGYNTPFDTKMIMQSLSIAKRKLQRKSDHTLTEEEKLNLDSVVENLKTFVKAMNSNSRCIMREYQDFSGNHKWVKLVQAASDCGVEVKNAHNAKGDCLMTLGVMKYMDRV